MRNWKCEVVYLYTPTCTGGVLLYTHVWHLNLRLLLAKDTFILYNIYVCVVYTHLCTPVRSKFISHELPVNVR